MVNVRLFIVSVLAKVYTRKTPCNVKILIVAGSFPIRNGVFPVVIGWSL